MDYHGLFYCLFLQDQGIDTEFWKIRYSLKHENRQLLVDIGRDDTQERVCVPMIYEFILSREYWNLMLMLRSGDIGLVSSREKLKGCACACLLANPKIVHVQTKGKAPRLVSVIEYVELVHCLIEHDTCTS